MDYEQVLLQFIAWTVSGTGAGVGFFIVRWLMVFLTGRHDKREAQIDASTDRLIKALEKRLDDVMERLTKTEADLAECKERHADSEARVKKLEATQAGFGDAKQQAQRIIAAEKIESKQ